MDSTMKETAPLTITNYDVLFSSEKSVTNAHVGNNRFEVMLNLHRETFNQALTRDDQNECDLIIDKLIDIVCHKCVPNGRFLEKRGNEWNDLGEGLEARERVREALQQSMDLTEQLESLELSQELPPIIPSMPLPEKLPPPPTMPMMAASSGSTMSPDKSDFDKKRRRRGSLAKLRRSISESMVPNMMNGIRPMPKRPTTSKWKSERNITIPIVTPSSSASTSGSIDVVFTRDGQSLDPLETYIGNNRFRVLLDMQANNFAHSNLHNQSCIAFDLVNTVMNHWNGRFLKPNNMNGSLQPLPTTESQKLVLGILHRLATTPALPVPPPALTNTSSPEIASMRSAAVKSLKARRQKQEISSRLTSQPRQTSNGVPSSLKNLFQKR